MTLMEDQFPELNERKDIIHKLIEAEERKFHETLDAGLSVLEETRQKLKSGSLFPGEKAFLLHDTYGFPLDLTEDALKAYDIKVDSKKFHEEMESQKDRSRKDRSDKGISFVGTKIDANKTEFLGYKDLTSESILSQIIKSEDEPNIISLIFDTTPFYAESGGQIGDTGLIEFADLKLKVIDTQKAQNEFWIHHCEILKGNFSDLLKGEKAKLSIDTDRRAKIRANHSATHIVHAALRTILGKHVKQAGSRVDDNNLRFDFSHFEPVSEAQALEIQDFINTEVRKNSEVITKVLQIDEARKTGAVALFGEKYGDKVRVVEIGPNSVEFCGGTHVTRSGDIGYIILKQETGVSAGVRRIECLAGFGAHQQILSDYTERNQIANLLKTDTADLSEKVEKQLNRIKSLERDLRDAQGKLATAKSGNLVDTARKSPSGIKVVVNKVDGADAKALRTMVDDLRNRLGSGVVALASQNGDTAIIVAGVTSDLTSTIDAGNLIKEASKISGGRGGGKADFAQAGGADPKMLDQALERLYQLVS